MTSENLEADKNLDVTEQYILLDIEHILLDIERRKIDLEAEHLRLVAHRQMVANGGPGLGAIGGYSPYDTPNLQSLQPYRAAAYNPKRDDAARKRLFAIFGDLGHQIAHATMPNGMPLGECEEVLDALAKQAEVVPLKSVGASEAPPPEPAGLEASTPNETGATEAQSADKFDKRLADVRLAHEAQEAYIAKRKSEMTKHDGSQFPPVAGRVWIRHMSESGHSGGNGWSDEIDWQGVRYFEVKPEGPPNISLSAKPLIIDPLAEDTALLTGETGGAYDPAIHEKPDDNAGIFETLRDIAASGETEAKARVE